jgi:hypothetical protein
MSRPTLIETAPAIDADFTRAQPDSEAESALRCAARAARRYWLSARTFRTSVLGIDSEIETYQRALHQFERRVVSLRSSPGGARRDIQPLPEPSRVDPWQVNPATIEAESRASAVCPDCDGNGRVTCSNCDGTTRARCSNCGGSGKVAAQRKGQYWKNCPRCRGDGTQKCGRCRGGLVDCTDCAATGIVTAWLSVERSMHAQVHVHPRNAAAAVHAGVDSPADFDNRSFVNALTSDTGAQRPGLVPTELYPSIDARTDRVHTTRIQSFSARVHRIHFANALSSGQVDVVGRPPGASTTSNWEPLRWRRSTSAAPVAVAICASFYLRYRYGARHEWFARFGDANVVLALSIVAAICLGWVIFGVTLRRARRRIGPYAAAVACALATGAAAVAFTHARPSAASARAALGRGALDDSRLEAQALIDLGIDRAGGEAVLDELQARSVTSATNCRQMAAAIRYPWHGALLRDQSLQHLRACVVREAAAAYSRGDDAGLNALASTVHDFNEAEAAGARWLASVIEACRSIAADNLRSADPSLGAVAELAKNVPASMRPTNYQELIETASSLRQLLAQSQSGSLRTQKQALTAAIDRARAFVALTPVTLPDAATALNVRLQKIRRQMARAERKAAERTNDRAAEKSEQHSEEQPAASDGVVNPY